MFKPLWITVNAFLSEDNTITKTTCLDAEKPIVSDGMQIDTLFSKYLNTSYIY